MACKDCNKREWCPYLLNFNINKDVGCIEFDNKEYRTTITTNTILMKWRKKMNSKEALEICRKYIVEEVCDIIEKDLEILDILKNYPICSVHKSLIRSSQNYEEYKNEWNIGFVKTDYAEVILNEDAYNKIKEWLNKNE